MNKIFEDMKIQAVPDESTVNLLMERLPEKRRKRRLHPVAAAAAIIVASFSLTAAVGAATDWTFNFLDNVSGGFDNDTASRNIVYSASYTNSASDLSFELVGAAADNGILRVIVDIYPPAGSEFNETNTPVFFDDISYRMHLKNYDGAYGCGGRHTILSQDPQKMKVMFDNDCTASLENKEIEFAMERPVYDDDGEFMDYEKIWFADISTGDAEEKETYNKLKLSDSKILLSKHGEYIIPVRAEIGSMTIKLFGFYSSTPTLDDDLCARLKDGTICGLSFFGAGGVDHEVHVDGSITFLFNGIVDPADVEALIINDREIVFEK